MLSENNDNSNRGGLLRNIIVVNFFHRFFRAGFMFMLPLYGIEKGWLDEYYGLILSIGGYAAMGMTFLLGLVVDIQFKKTTMIIGIISTIISAVLFTRINIQVLSIIFFCFFTIGQQLMMISTNTFIANETKKGKHRTRGFSGNMIFGGISRALAPLICGYLLIVLIFDWVFTIMAVFGLVALILVLVLRLAFEETPREEIDHAEQLSVDSGDDFTSFASKKRGKSSVLGVQISFGIGRTLMGFASGVAIPFVSWYIINEFSPDTELWGWINFTSFMFLILGYLFMSWIAEKVGKDIIVVVFWALVIPAAVGIMLAKTLFWVSFFFILRTFFAMTPSAAWNSFLFEWIPPKHRGKTLGALQTAQRGMRATGTLIGGYVFGILGVALFPIAMIAYPVTGLLPMIQSKIVKRRLEKISMEEPPTELVSPFEESYPVLADSVERNK